LVAASNLSVTSFDSSVVTSGLSVTTFDSLVVTFVPTVTTSRPSVAVSDSSVTTFTPLVAASGSLVVTFALSVITFRINTHTCKGKPMNVSYSCAINNGGKAVKSEVKYGSL
jgi:hypothetical protein